MAKRVRKPTNPQTLFMRALAANADRLERDVLAWADRTPTRSGTEAWYGWLQDAAALLLKLGTRGRNTNKRFRKRYVKDG